MKRVTTISEMKSGRNTYFRDNSSHRIMSRTEFVTEIKRGNYPNHHVRVINGIETPVSNPDNSTRNNLG